MAAQIIPASYNNQTKRILIPDLREKIVPDSPEDIRIPVPESGFVSPMPGIGTPQEPVDERQRVDAPPSKLKG